MIQTAGKASLYVRGHRIEVATHELESEVGYCDRDDSGQNCPNSPSGLFR